MKRSSMCAWLVAAAVCSMLAATVRDAVASPWSSAGSLSERRYGAVAAPLPGGDVLVAGGRPDNSGPAFASTEIFDGATGRWSSGAAMAEAREHASTSVLPDGRVLVAGGRATAFAELDSAEVYDPGTGSWEDAGTLNAARVFHRAVVLAGGRVMVIGGDGPEDPALGAEIWDPDTNVWTATGPVRRVRSDPSATLLADGRVLVAGGWDGAYQATAEIYDAATDEWTDTGSMGEPRMGHGASVLPDGSVLVAGGHRWVDMHPDTSRTSETFDPAAGTWSPAGMLSTPRGEGATMETLPDGRAVIVGGFWWSTVTPAPPGGLPSWSDSRYEGTAEVFTPSTRSWIQTEPMMRGRAGHVSAVLADGTVLVAGGFEAGTLAERLDPAAIVHWPQAPSQNDPPPISTPKVPDTSRRPSPQPARGKLVFARPRPKRFVVNRSGNLAVRLRCIGAGDCKDRLTVTIVRRGARKVLARTAAVVALGDTERISIKLSPRARRRARRGPVRIVATDSGIRLTRSVTDVRKRRRSLSSAVHLATRWSDYDPLRLALIGVKGETKES